MEDKLSFGGLQSLSLDSSARNPPAAGLHGVASTILVTAEVMSTLGLSISVPARSALANGLVASLASRDKPLFEFHPGPFCQNEFVVLEFNGQ